MQEIIKTYDPIQNMIKKDYSIEKITIKNDGNYKHFDIIFKNNKKDKIALVKGINRIEETSKENNDYTTTIFSIINYSEIETYIIKENEKIQKIIKLDEDNSYTSDSLLDKNMLIKIKYNDDYIYVNNNSKIYDMYIKNKLEDNLLYDLAVAQAYIDNTKENKEGKKILAKKFGEGIIR